MAVTSTTCAGAGAGEEEVAEAAGVVGGEDVTEAAGAFGAVGVTAATAAVGEATAGEAGVAALEGAAAACPNIFDMRFVNIPIGVKYAPLRGKKPAGLAGSEQSTAFGRAATRARSERVSPSSVSRGRSAGQPGLDWPSGPIL